MSPPIGDIMGSPFPGPTPPYSNPAIQPQNYVPRQYFISNVSLGPTTTVTTTAPMDFVISQLVRLIIPPSFGCRQLNEQTGYVISIPANNQVALNINSSRNVNAFKSSSATTQPQIIPVGDVNSGPINTSPANQTTFIPGSFINIS